MNSYLCCCSYVSCIILSFKIWRWNYHTLEGICIFFFFFWAPVCSVPFIIGHANICDAVSACPSLLPLFPLSRGHQPIIFTLSVIIKEDMGPPAVFGIALQPLLCTGRVIDVSWWKGLYPCSCPELRTCPVKSSSSIHSLSVADRAWFPQMRSQNPGGSHTYLWWAKQTVVWDVFFFIVQCYFHQVFCFFIDEYMKNWLLIMFLFTVVSELKVLHCFESVFFSRHKIN